MKGIDERNGNPKRHRTLLNMPFISGDLWEAIQAPLETHPDFSKYCSAHYLQRLIERSSPPLPPPTAALQLLYAICLHHPQPSAHSSGSR